MAIFSGKRYFIGILWAHAYNTNTLLLAAIRYKKRQGSSQWKGKRKRGHFFKTPISNVNICVAKKLGIEGEFSNAQMTIYLRRQ
jgi:hypothetical protein